MNDATWSQNGSNFSIEMFMVVEKNFLSMKNTFAAERNLNFSFKPEYKKTTRKLYDRKNVD